MGNVIAGFLVRLGFTFDKDELKKFEGTVDSVGKGMMSLAKRGVAAGVAITAAITKANSEVNKLYTLANNTSSSVRGIRTLGNAVKAVGGSAEDAQSAIQSLANHIKYDNFEPFLNSLGVGLRDAQGSVRDTTDVILDLRNVLASMPQEQGRRLADQIGLGSVYEAMMKDDFVQELQRSRQLLTDLSWGMNDASKASHNFSNEFSRSLDIVGMAAGSASAQITKLLGLDGKLADFNDSLASSLDNLIRSQTEIIASSDGFLDWADKTFADPLASWYRNFMDTKIGTDEIKAFGRGFVDFIIPDVQRPQTQPKDGNDARQVIDDRLISVRGMRNNNPGNLRSGQGQIGSDRGGYAVFDTPEAGYSAAARQLMGYYNAGLDNVASLISKWAPSSENNTKAYIDSVVQSMNRKGFNVDAYSALNLRDSKVLQTLLESIINHENGNGASSYFQSPIYDRIVQQQSQNEWKSKVVSDKDKIRPNVTINQNVTINGVNDPQRIKREIDPAQIVQNNMKNLF